MTVYVLKTGTRNNPLDLWGTLVYEKKEDLIEDLVEILENEDIVRYEINIENWTQEEFDKLPKFTGAT
jgi:hypothetical protein